MNGARFAAVLATVAVMVGCEETAPLDPDAGARTEFEAQVAEGQTLFGTHCAHCHGADGRGTTEAPPLVGLDEGALPLEPRPGSVRATQFVTVGDVAAFAAVNMPADDPGSLATDEYYAILAFALFANEIVLEERLTPGLAEELTIPR